MSRSHLAAVPDRPGRVVLYVRVSALMGRGGDEFHSPDVQIGAMRRLTAGMREVDVIDDDIDVSGRSFSRDGIARIRALAEAGDIDVLAVYNLARFGRNTLEGLQFLLWLADRGVTILSASEHVDTSTPSGRWMLTNLLAMAEMRSDEIGVEWGSVIRHRALAGRHHGKPPTGYARGEDGRLTEAPAAGPAVRRLFAGYADGLPVRDLTRNLQAATGLKLATSTVKGMLRNRAYRGVVRVGARGPAGVVEVEDAHPALVDEQTWRRVQARLAEDRSKPARLVAPKYPLSGLGRCGACEGRTNHRIHGDVVRIFCATKAELRNPRCTGCGYSNVAEVEAAVLQRTREHIARLKGDVGAQAAQASKASRAAVDAATVGDELDATNRAMARLTERWARERLDDRAYEGAMASLRADADRLTATLGGLHRVVDAPEPGKLIALGEKLLRLWPRMDGEQRNRSLRDLIVSVTIAPAEFFRQPLDLRIEVLFRD